jgi:large subunit ribosomal protein L21
MMYAVIKTGGKQYKVQKDDVISIEKLDLEVGKKVDFDVLFLADGDTVIVDGASLAKAKVTGEVVDQYKDDKVIVFKFKKRKGYKRLRGHRQNLTMVRITKIAK